MTARLHDEDPWMSSSFLGGPVGQGATRVRPATQEETRHLVRRRPTRRGHLE
jgi:hypothetical protein